MVSMVTIRNVYSDFFKHLKILFTIKSKKEIIFDFSIDNVNYYIYVSNESQIICITEKYPIKGVYMTRSFGYDYSKNLFIMNGNYDCYTFCRHCAINFMNYKDKFYQIYDQVYDKILEYLQKTN